MKVHDRLLWGAVSQPVELLAHMHRKNKNKSWYLHPHDWHIPASAIDTFLTCNTAQR